MPTSWELVISGITNNNCTICDTRYNGAFCLEYDTGCIWRSCSKSADSGCRAGTLWLLFYTGSTWAVLSSAEGVANEGDYQISGSFSCSGSNTFTRITASNGDCASWPASLTLEPVT